MIQKVAVACCLLLGARIASASDLDGKIAAVDSAAHSITVSVDGKDQKYPLANDCKVYVKGFAKRTVQFNEAAEGTKALAAGQTVTLSTDLVDGKDEAVRIKILSVAAGSRLPAAAKSEKVDPSKQPTAGTTPDQSAAEKKESSADVQGQVTAVDLRRSTIALTSTDGKSLKFKVLKSASFFLATPSGKKVKLDAAPGGLADVTAGADVTLSFMDDTSKIVSIVKINRPSKKSDKKK